ncbi:MAG: hypothetical protein HZA24_03605 [Nitrospirae bacterium]|nr:hypothetical protein [Nitrospirota bacterium]
MIRIAVHGAGGGPRPLTFGVPLARGVLADPAALALTQGGRALPVQGAATATWPDGSVKWLLVDTVVDGAEELALTPGGVPGRHDALATVAADGWRADAGVAALATGPQGALLELRAQTPGAAPVSACLRLLDGNGMERAALVERIEAEAGGPVRATVCLRGGFFGTPLRFVCRVDAFAGLAAARVTVTLHNPRAAVHAGGLWDLGDPGSVPFRRLAWDVAAPPAAEPHWRLVADGETRSGLVAIHQASSGGAHWDSLNHVDRDGRVTLPFKGYRVTGPDGQVAAGGRCQPALESGGAALVLERFWQNFPKRLAATAEGLSLELFPDQSPPHELQGGERKTHTLWLAVGPDALERAATLAEPRLALADPAAVQAGGAIPLFTARDASPDPAYETLIEPAVRGARPLVARREIPDEYGWRHFGDLYADHEELHYQGAQPLVSHYNNQYDCVHGLLIQCLRSGDPAWAEPALDLARHVTDIDIYHTQADRSAYNGGLFWHTDHYEHAGNATHRTYSRRSLRGRPAGRYGGGPANEHCYTSGLLLFHHLTGDPHAREAVLTLADWVIAMDDGTRTVLGWVDGGPTGHASRTCEAEFHGPGRGAGNAVNALLDAATLSADPRYREKAEELLRRTIHPADDPDALRLDQPELRWSYTVHLQALGRYLLWKEERGQLDAAHDHARRCLLAYARWMAEREAPWLERPDKLEFPTETWAAQEIRKACVLDLAARYADGAERERLRARAAFFRERSLSGLAGFPTADATRPIAILLSCGWQHAWFSAHPDEAGPVAAGDFDPGPPAAFVSQKRRVLGWLRSPLGWPRLALGLLRNAPARLRRRPCG